MTGLEELAVGVSALWAFSTGLRRSFSVLRFGRGAKVVVVGLGSPVIWARRSPILTMLLDMILRWMKIEEEKHIPAS